MNREKFNKEDLYKLSAIQVYNLVLEGKDLKTFPNGFWVKPEAMDNAKILIKYLIEEKLKLSDDELKEQLSAKLFSENKLRTMLNKCFNGSPLNAIMFAYPNKFKPWEYNIVPKGFWADKENIISATKWLVDEKLKLSDEELKNQLSVHMFKNNGLTGMLNVMNSSPFEIINLAYPGKFYPWEFNIAPIGFWEDEDNRVMAIKWLIEDKLKLNDSELKQQLSADLFIDNGLGGLLTNYFNGSPFEAINLAYPNKFKPWQFNTVSRGYWTKENIIKATKWLVEDELKLSDKELKEQLCGDLFINNGLGGLLHSLNNSPFEAINLAYPKKFYPWEFNIVPTGYWDCKENRARAIKWLIEDKLKLNKNELNTISVKDFKNNSLGALLRIQFNNNLKNAIKEYLEYYNI